MASEDLDSESFISSIEFSSVWKLANSVGQNVISPDANEPEAPNLAQHSNISREKLLDLLKLNKELEAKLKARLLAVCDARKQNEEQRKLVLQMVIKRSSSCKKYDLQMENLVVSRYDKRNVKPPLIRTGDKAEDNVLMKYSNFTYTPFFIDERGHVPNDNRDTIKNYNNPPLYKTYAAWYHEERKALVKAIRAENLRVYTADKKRKKDSKERFNAFLVNNITGIIWQNVTELVPGRKWRECAIRWTCYDHPSINRKEWTQEELTRLIEVAEAHKCLNWPLIAGQASNNRTAIQCFKRYMGYLNSKPSRVRWTETEDAILREGVRVYGERSWIQISLLLNNRCGSSCNHRWRNTLRHKIIHKRWSKADDEALRQAVAIKGVGNWMRVFPLVPGRTDVQCRERWVNVLDPELDRSLWTPQQDATLCKLINIHGLGKWSHLATILKGRTDNMIWRRFKNLVNFGGIDSQILTHPDFTNQLKHNNFFPTKYHLAPKPPKQGTKRRNKRVYLTLPCEVTPHRPVGGANTDHSTIIEGRLHTDLDKGRALPPCNPNTKVYSNLLSDLGLDDSFDVDSPAPLDPFTFASQEDILKLEKTFRSLFAWPHLGCSIDMDLETLDKLTNPEHPARLDPPNSSDIDMVSYEAYVSSSDDDAMD